MITKSSFDHQVAETRNKMLAQAMGEIDTKISAVIKAGGRPPIHVSAAGLGPIIDDIVEAYISVGWLVSVNVSQRDGDDLVFQ
ncbi:MAG TPA: hypothetical protein VEL07_19325 [Planctomycetota bacterium]|nr:hypothetical protein [Planctomycetota bacterium]